MTGFDYEVCHYFVKDADRFGERGGDVAEGVEELFYCWGFYGSFRELEVERERGVVTWKGKLVLSVSKFKRPLWRAARARTSVIFMFSLGGKGGGGGGFEFLVFSNGSFEEEWE